MKCTICTFGSWIVGLATLGAGVAGVFGWVLPTGPIATVPFVVFVLTALGFLYYQIVPCPRCSVVIRHRLGGSSKH